MLPDTPQIAFPVRVVNGQIHTVEQGSTADAASQVHVLCLTPQGWLSTSPDFGLYEQAHLSGGADGPEIERQISEYVPDAQAAVDEDRESLNVGLSVIGVRIGA